MDADREHIKPEEIMKVTLYFIINILQTYV